MRQKIIENQGENSVRKSPYLPEVTAGVKTIETLPGGTARGSLIFPDISLESSGAKCYYRNKWKFFNGGKEMRIFQNGWSGLKARASAAGICFISDTDDVAMEKIASFCESVEEEEEETTENTAVFG